LSISFPAENPKSLKEFPKEEDIIEIDRKDIGMTVTETRMTVTETRMTEKE
jgi:hypothetical protein